MAGLLQSHMQPDMFDLYEQRLADAVASLSREVEMLPQARQSAVVGELTEKLLQQIEKVRLATVVEVENSPSSEP